jgi:hypothetical protein
LFFRYRYAFIFSKNVGLQKWCAAQASGAGDGRLKMGCVLKSGAFFFLFLSVPVFSLSRCLSFLSLDACSFSLSLSSAKKDQTEEPNPSLGKDVKSEQNLNRPRSQTAAPARS